jgi:hypothetical protein
MTAAMAKAHAEWKVLPHRPIEQLDDRVWRVEGDLGGMPLKRVMTIARAGSGKLVVHNAMALDDESMKAIDAWGEVAVVLVPNGYHRLDAPAFHARYPKARVLCPAGARKRVQEVVPVSGTYEDLGPDEVVSLQTLDGTKQAEGAMIARGSSGTTVVLNDLVFNMPHAPGFTGWVLRHVTGSSGGVRVSRIARWFIVADARELAAHLERLASISDLARVVVSHHQTIDRDPAAALRAVAASL